MHMAYDPYRRSLPRSVPLDTALKLRDQAQAALAAEEEARAAYQQLRRRYDSVQVEVDALRHQVSEGRAAREQLDRAREQLVVAREQLAAREAEVDALRAELSEVAPPAEPEVPVDDDRAEALERQLDELRRDLANVRRHRDEAVARAGQEARAEGLVVLADSIDDLDRALRALPDGDVAEGVVALRERLLRRVHELGATTFAGAGDAFDPERHEAIGLTTGPEGTVASVERRGLSWVDGPVIRPALVVVGDGREGAGRNA